MRLLWGAPAIISLALIALAVPARAAPASPSSGAPRYEELLVSVLLNGVIVDENTFVIEDDRGTYYAGAADVTAWNLRRAGRRSVELRGQRYFALDDLSVHFDTHSGLLSIIALPSAFSLNVVDFQNVGHPPAAAPSLESGGFLNYDIAHHFGNARHRLLPLVLWCVHPARGRRNGEHRATRQRIGVHTLEYDV